MHKFRFLEPDLDVLGHNNHKMTFKKDMPRGNVFSLRIRMCGIGKKAPASIVNWRKGRDLFYIRCSSGRFRKGYIAAVRRRNPDTQEHVTELKCYNSVKSHNDENVSMLFQVHLFAKHDIDERRKTMDKHFCYERARAYNAFTCGSEARPESREYEGVIEVAAIDADPDPPSLDQLNL